MVVEGILRRAGRCVRGDARRKWIPLVAELWGGGIPVALGVGGGFGCKVRAGG